LQFATNNSDCYGEGDMTQMATSDHDKKGTIPPNAQNRYEVTRADLPLHCPMNGMSLWNSHPRVFLPIEDTGRAKCPYCGAEYVLSDHGGM
jgi:uncharacterized Zn-finger protein